METLSIVPRGRFVVRAIQLKARDIGPGLALAAMIAMAAQFISDHYGAPVMLMAILLGIPFQFLSQESRTGPGIQFAARVVLRIGVALLGLRVSVEMIHGLGMEFILVVFAGVFLTIICSIVLAPMLGKDRLFGFLTGGAVAICGASAALAISSVLPKTEDSERNLSFTVIAVTLMSTVAMIFYPILAESLGLDARHAGVFLGGTIHDVAQVVGAGYSIDTETGDFSTVVKLFRVTLLAPIVFLGALALRNQVPAGAKRPPLIPGFVLAFLIFAALNSMHLIPEVLVQLSDTLSRAALVTAVAAVGMKTSIGELRSLGGASVAMIIAQTIGLAVFVLAFVVM